MYMALSWNEIRKRAIKFSKEWEDNTDSEISEAQTFWNELFDVFGIKRRMVARFEKSVKRLDKKKGYIDLFWKKLLMVEHKSLGKDLKKAVKQSKNYFLRLEDEDLPKYLIVCDFNNFELYDVDESWDLPKKKWKLKNLSENIENLAFLKGEEVLLIHEEEDVNIKAAELMAHLYDVLEKNGYGGTDLQIFLVRILFCLFADDTGIFIKQSFERLIKTKTKIDGTDLGPFLLQFFDVLNTPQNSRQKNLDEDLDKFPFIDGNLFEESIKIPNFDSATREEIINCCLFNWKKVNPAIFGSLFQLVMDKIERHQLGAHYTSEENIMKVIKPLFLDRLIKKYHNCDGDINKLKSLLKEISEMNFFDPACGCGNFLILTYRELRRLEIKIHKKIISLGGDKSIQTTIDGSYYKGIDVDSMHGIEIKEFTAKIAQVALWIMDHLMNQEFSETFGKYVTRFPIRKSGDIRLGNSLKMNWEDIFPEKNLTAILGNPPFVSKQNRSKEQNNDMVFLF